jgi:hypothetical protein
VIVPPEAAGTVPHVATGCIDLKVGEARNMDVSVEPVKAAEGAGAALLPVTLHSAATGSKKSQRVSFDLPLIWRFSDPLNRTVLIGVFAVVGLVSVALPLLAVGLANRLSARFETKGLRVGTIPVLVDTNGVRRQNRLQTRPDRVIDAFNDLSVMRPPNVHRFTVDDVELRARGTINPFGAPSFLATPPPGTKIMSSVGLSPAGDRRALVNPGLGFVVLAVVTDADLAAEKPNVPAKLVLLLRDEQIDPAVLDQLMNQRMRWDKIAIDWRDGLDGSVSFGDSQVRDIDDGSTSSYLNLD